MTTLRNKIVNAVRRILHLGRIEAQQLEIQRQVENVRNATDEAMVRLDKLRGSDDPLANFVHGARSATFKRRNRKSKK